MQYGSRPASIFKLSIQVGIGNGVDRQAAVLPS